MIVAFLGPSLPAAEVRGLGSARRGKTPPFRVMPPARQGDIWRALRLRPRAIALIDGVFESQPSVWHHEILDALDAGVAVFGGASMGALRAAELHTRGMIGVGRIFRWYRDGVVIDDSEVALLHADAEHGFRPLTVPQVNVRWAAQEAVRAGVLRTREARALVDRSARIFYQERTWPLLLQDLPMAALAKWKKWSAPDLKAQDAFETLQAAQESLQVGSKSQVQRPPSPREPAPSSLVRRRRASAGDLWRRPDAAALADAGLRRVLLAGWARDLGLRATAAEIEAAQQRWKNDLRTRDLPAVTGLDAAEVLRFCEDLALERLVLDQAPRFVNDGPSADEALLAEARLRGLAAGTPPPKPGRTGRGSEPRRAWPSPRSPKSR